MDRQGVFNPACSPPDRTDARRPEQNHEKTYGKDVWETVTSNLPSDQILLHDTGVSGRPDIASLIERVAKQHEAEAVFVVVSVT